jgi:hypothetical protein
MGGDGSASGGCRLRNTTCLTATPSAAGRLPPTFSSVSSHLLDLYRECVDNGGWARVIYDARGGMEKLIFIRKVQPMPAPAASAPPHKPGRPASDRRRARDKRRREAWAERRRNRSQSRLHTQPAEDDLLSVPDRAVTATISAAVSPSPPSPDASTSQPASSASPLPASSPSASPSPQPAPPPRKRAKTYCEATRASSRAAVLSGGKYRNSTAASYHPRRHRRQDSQLPHRLPNHPSYRLHLQHLRRGRRPRRDRPLCLGECHRGERLHQQGQIRPDVLLLPQPPGSSRLHRHPATPS